MNKIETATNRVAKSLAALEKVVIEADAALSDQDVQKVTAFIEMKWQASLQRIQMERQHTGVGDVFSLSMELPTTSPTPAFVSRSHANSRTPDGRIFTGDRTLELPDDDDVTFIEE